MAAEIANAILNITPSLNGLSREIDRQLRGVDARRAGAGVGDDFASGFGSAAKKLAAVVAGAFAGVKLKDFAVDAINNASDLNEVGTKIQQVFGDGAAEVQAFGKQGAKVLGQTNLQAQNAAATFGVFGKAAGLAGKENAAFSTELAKLATDMASFSNTTPEQAIEALAAGLRGESEPLRSYGVLLDDASLRQEALAQGLITTTKDALTPQQKVLAAHALIMKQTTDAQGDFARTSGGLANQQRILAAQWEDSKGKLGEAFLPAVTSVVAAMNDKLFPILETAGAKVSDAWKLLSTGDFQGGTSLGDEDSPLVNALFTARDVFQDTKGVIQEAWSILAAGDFKGGLGLEEDSPLVDFLFTLRDFGLTTLDRFQGIWEKVKTAAVDMWPSIKSIAQSLGEATVSVGVSTWDIFLGIIDSLADALNDYLVPALDWLAGFMRENPGLVSTLVAAYTGYKVAVLAINVATTAWTAVQAALNAVMTANPIVLVITALAALAAGVIWAYNNVEWFRDLVDNAWDVIVTASKWAWEYVLKPTFEFIVDALQKAGDFFSWLWDTVSDVWGWISDKISTVWNWLRDNVFEPLGDGIVAVGDFFSGLWQTVSDVWTWISDKVTTVWNWIRDSVFAPLNAGITNVGSFFSGLWKTVSDVWQWIQDKISGAWNWINANVFAPMILGINTIMTWSANLWTTIEGVWNKIKGFFADIAAGISSAVDTVKTAISDITKAIEDFIAEKFGLDDRPNGVFGLRPTGELLGVGPPSARGGIVPGVDPGRRDNVLMPLRSEEAVMVPEFTHAVGGAAGVYALNRAAETGRLTELFGPGFARGGVVGQWAHDAVVNPVMAFFERIIDDFLGQFAAGGGVAPDGARGRFLDALRSKIGTEYVWGAAGPNVFDCSGLISWALEQAGVGKGRLTAQGFNAGFPHVATPSPGDMITFDTGRLPGQAGHIGAVSDPSRQMMIHTDGAGLAREQSYAGRPGFLGFVNVIGEEYKPKPPASLGGSEGDPATGTLDRIIGKIKAGGTGVASVSGSGTWGTTAKLNTNTPDQWANDGTMAMVGPVPPGGAVDRWRPMYADALMAKGMFSDTALDKMMYQMQRESSGNPLAINKSDRNWRAGYPSKSLLQVIGPTFRDNGEPGFNTNIWDPWSNALASLNYVYRRYGGPQNYPGGAYDQGGWLMPGGSGVNLLNKPEAVLTPPQSDALITHAQNLARGFGGRAELDPGAIRQALDGMTMQLEDGGNSIRLIARREAVAVAAAQSRVSRVNGGR